MTHHATRVPVRLTGLALGAFLLAVTPAAVAATTNTPIAETGGMTATLPLLGTPLTVAVTLDAGGKISGVALDPSTALSKTKSGDDFVKFTNTDGSVKVVVRAKGGQLAIKAKAKQLGDLLGDGTWSADVFGTGTRSTADYTVGKDSSGNPTVSIGTVNTSSGVVWTPTPTPATVHKVTPGLSKFGDKAKGTRASASGTFSWQGFKKTLTISVAVRGDGTAGLSISLTGRDAQKLNGALANLAGARSWTADTCAGTPVKVSYHVASDGTVVYDGATGGTATEKTFAHGFVAFFDKGQTGVFVNVSAQTDGTYSLLVLGRSGDCGGNKHGGHGHGHWNHWQWGPPNMTHGQPHSKPKSH